MTENKFEKSRKGRGVIKLLIANGKIAEVIFSTLLSQFIIFFQGRSQNPGLYFEDDESEFSERSFI